MARRLRNLQLYLLMTVVLMLIYSLQRVSFLAWNWKSFQNQGWQDLIWSLIVGWRFDLSAICLLSALFFVLAMVLDFSPPLNGFKRWFESLLASLFALAHSFFIVVNWGDIEFVNFVGRRFTADSFFIASEIPGKFMSIVLTYWPLALGMTICLLIFWLSKWVLLRRFEGRHLNMVQNLVLAGLIFVLLILGGRGGLQFKPLSFVQAQVFKTPSHNNLVLNSTFTVIKSIGKQKLARNKWLPAGVDGRKFLNGAITSESVFSGFAKPPNVVLIIVEGMNLEYLGEPFGPVTYAPFLRELSEKGLSWRHFFANGRRSIEGIASLYAGIPSLMSEPFITSPFQTNTYEGLGTIFEKNNYSTSFFHGGANGTMFFDSFMKATGVRDYFGLNEYPNRDDYDGTWGIFDEPYLQYAIQKLDQMNQPFFTGVFTLSSHHPFKVPEKYAGKFNKGVAPIHESIGYVDFAIRQFFDSASTKSWYQNTLFIITADHTSQSFNAKSDNEVGHYQIPLIFYYPGFKRQDWPSLDVSQMGSQIDLLPTLVDILKLKSKYQNDLGQSLFKPGNKAVVHYMDGRYQLLEEDLALEWTAANGYRLYDWRLDPMVQQPLTGGEDLPRKEQMILKLQAHIDYFNQGMWDNKLYYPN